MTAPQSNWRKENDFDFMLFPAQSGKAKSLVICLHGIGSDARIEPRFIKAIQNKLPDADIISLQAPYKVRKPLFGFGDNGGYTWLPYGEEGPIRPQAQAWLSHLFNRLTIAEKVEAFAKAQLDKRGLDEQNLAYIGTSMGGIVALQAALPSKKPVAAVVSRGSLVLPLTRVKSKPPVFLQMGEKDEVFNRPPQKPKGFLKRIFSLAVEPVSWRHESSVERLKKKGVPLTEKVYPNLGHSLDYVAWNEGLDFIVKALNPPKPSAPPPKPAP